MMRVERGWMGVLRREGGAREEGAACFSSSKTFLSGGQPRRRQLHRPALLDLMINGLVHAAYRAFFRRAPPASDEGPNAEEGAGSIVGRSRAVKTAAPWH